MWTKGAQRGADLSFSKGEGRRGARRVANLSFSFLPPSHLEHLYEEKFAPFLLK